MTSPEQQHAAAGDDAPVVKDAAYYAQVRQSVGRGAPTILLGTSTRSLDRSLKKLEAVQRKEWFASSDYYAIVGSRPLVATFASWGKAHASIVSVSRSRWLLVGTLISSAALAAVIIGGVALDWSRIAAGNIAWFIGVAAAMLIIIATIIPVINRHHKSANAQGGQPTDAHGQGSTAGVLGTEHEDRPHESHKSKRKAHSVPEFPKLKDALREWVNDAISRLSGDGEARDVSIDLGHWQRDPDGVFRYAERTVEIWDRKSVESLFSLPRWAAVLDVLQSDDRLKRQLDTLVGTVQLRRRIEATNIGRMVLPRPNELDELNEMFERRYAELEGFLAADEIEYTAVWPLPGLVSTALPVRLDSTLELDTMSDRELGFALDNDVIRPRSPHGKLLSPQDELRTCARYHYRVLKVFGDSEIDASSQLFQVIEDRLRNIESALEESLALVLHEPIGVAGRFSVVSEPGSPLSGAVLFQQSTLPQGMRLRRANLTDDQAAELLEVWQELHQPGLLQRRKGLALALHRLSYQAQWERPEEELLDAMIAAEALYLTELGNETERGELRYRLAQRAAFLADPERVGYSKREVLRIMQSAYDVRSKIAHGSIPNPEEMKVRGQVVSLEELVRVSKSIIVQGCRAALAIAASPSAAWPPDWDALALSGPWIHVPPDDAAQAQND